MDIIDQGTDGMSATALTDLIRSLVAGSGAADELARRMDARGMPADAAELRGLAARMRREAGVAMVELAP